MIRNMKFMKIVQFDLKWVQMAPYYLILRLDGAQRLRIISKPLLTPQKPMTRQKKTKESKKKYCISISIAITLGSRC